MVFVFNRRTLADIIMEKITEKQTEVGTVMSEVSGRPMPQLDPRVIEVYRGVSKVSTYCPSTSQYNCSLLLLVDRVVLHLPNHSVILFSLSGSVKVPQWEAA